MRAYEFVIEATIPMDPSRRGFLKKAAGTAAAGAAMSAAGPQITALVTNFTKEVGGMNGIQALKAMFKVATADEIYNIYDYYADSGILEDAIAESDLAALARINYDWSDFEEHCEENDIHDYFEEFQRLTGQPLKVALVNQIIDKIDPGWGVEYFFDQYPEALEMIDPYSEVTPTLQKLENIDVAAKGANLPAPVVTAANAISGLVRQIFKSNGKPLTAPQPVKAAPALSAPTRPEVELPVDIKQKQAEPVKRQGNEVAESNPVPLGKGDTLRDYVFDEIEQIYQGAITGEDMTDQIADELNDYFNAVKRSKDPLLKQAYDIALRLGSYTPDIQATGALKALRLLSGNPSLVPAPQEPLTPDQQREVDDMVQKMSAAFTGALASRGIKAHPDWNKDKGQLTEFDPGPGGFGPFKVYYEQDYFIGQFPTYEEAKGEVDFLRQSDPKSATHHWRIVDGTGETVWEYDIGDDIDAWRRGQKFQKRP